MCPSSTNAAQGSKPPLRALNIENAIEKAWDNPRKWVTVVFDQGIRRVMCSPRTSKSGNNYWIWAYDVGVSKPVFRATKRPLK